MNEWMKMSLPLTNLAFQLWPDLNPETKQRWVPRCQCHEKTMSLWVKCKLCTVAWGSIQHNVCACSFLWNTFGHPQRIINKSISCFSADRADTEGTGWIGLLYWSDLGRLSSVWNTGGKMTPRPTTVNAAHYARDAVIRQMMCSQAQQ